MEINTQTQSLIIDCKRERDILCLIYISIITYKNKYYYSVKFDYHCAIFDSKKNPIETAQKHKKN